MREPVALVDCDDAVFDSPLADALSRKYILRELDASRLELEAIRNELVFKMGYHGIVLPDMMFPKDVYTDEESRHGTITGLLLLRDIRATSSVNSQTPVVIYGLSTDENIIDLAREYGADAYIKRTNDEAIIFNKRMLLLK